MRASDAGRHISGAEGLYREGEITGVLARYLKRALEHDRGKPDTVVFTVEKVAEEPLLIESLPVRTVETSGYPDAWRFVRTVLERHGVSAGAARRGMAVIESGEVMRGAALVRAVSGERVEPDRERGVRVKRLGMDPSLLSELAEALGPGLDLTRVAEALVLASKVASCPHVVAEVCVSDDPFYTTGYVSSRGSGYLRVPGLKEEGAMNGGRVFFVTEGCSPGEVVRYLQERPVIVTGFGGVISDGSPEQLGWAHGRS